MTMDNISELKSVKKKYSAYLLSLPNVEGVGIGWKVSGGQKTQQPAIKVFVKQKISCDKLAESELIPEQLEGVPTDVEVLAPLRAN